MTALALRRMPRLVGLAKVLALIALLGAISTTVYSCSSGSRSYDGGMSGEDGGDRG